MLAQRCARSSVEGDPGDLVAAWSDVRAIFVATVMPHMALEERLLLPQLAAVGEMALVERARREHVRLREIVEGVRAREGLQQLGKLLAAHVLFEEGELFPRAERTLSDATLAAVAAADRRHD